MNTVSILPPAQFESRASRTEKEDTRRGGPFLIHFGFLFLKFLRPDKDFGEGNGGSVLYCGRTSLTNRCKKAVLRKGEKGSQTVRHKQEANGRGQREKGTS